MNKKLNILFYLVLGVILGFSCQVETKMEAKKVLKKLDPSNYNVALLIMDGTFNTELTAPMDIFHHTIFRENIKPMNVFTIANTYEPITTFEELKIIPDFNYLDSVPNIDVLVIPAAENNLGMDLEDTTLINFITQTSKKCKYVMSHCDGSFVLAKTGLLDGKKSTTFPGDIDEYRKSYSATKVIDSVLFVHDGKFITSTGGAKSFEASLYLCELMYGKKVVDEIAEGMVIDWNLDSIKFSKF